MTNQDLLQSLVPATTKPLPTVAQQRAIQIFLAALDSPDTPQSTKIEIAEHLLDYSTAAPRVNARERIRQRTLEQSPANDGVRSLWRSSEVAVLVTPSSRPGRTWGM